MADENVKDQKYKKDKAYKPKKNTKIDKPTLIFFICIIIGLITFTIILLVQSSKTVYVANFGEEMSSTIKIDDSKTKIDLIMDVKGSTSKQHGTLSVTDDANIYIAELVVSETETETVELIFNETELILRFDDGTEILYKEKK